MTETTTSLIPLLRALHFAAWKHRDQRRKGVEASPYINHLIEVASLLAEHGVGDLVTLQAAALHDTIEDTETTADELDRAFGPEVRAIVEEVSDDKSLPKDVRKRLQVEHAPHLSHRAQQIKIGDKISNIRSIVHHPPADWSLGRRVEYLDWSRKVVDGCRGANRELESLYDHELQEGRRALQAEATP